MNGQNLLDLSERQMCDIRGDDIAMIFQEPMTSLNPVLTCGFQIMEAVVLHQGVSKQEARSRAIDMLRLVGIPAPEQRIDEYPHQLSGGMRQRVMIAMALSCNPDLLIADEPTTALDVTIQAQILELLQRLQEELHMAILLITHDLGVIAETAARVAVMYAGKVVEYSETADLFKAPAHPYTRGLMASIPRLDTQTDRLEIIPGLVPDATSFPSGCRFSPRCPLADDHCRAEEPSLKTVTPGHLASCWKAESASAVQ
jgi:oligopeptide/dipeptide ABC transporter ATP-binding protein